MIERVTVVSAFRNMSGRVDRYMRQVASLQDHFVINLIAVEGDSVDATRFDLVKAARDHNVALTIVTHNHGQRVFGSTEHPDRLTALTGVLKAGMAAASTTHCEAILYVESDLIWAPTVAASLIRLLDTHQEADVVAPMIFAGEHFYDVWGFRKDGQRFSPFPPYHSNIADAALAEVDSVGSCLAFRHPLANIQPIGEEALVSWCRGVKAAGHRIFVAKWLSINHP